MNDENKLTPVQIAILQILEQHRGIENRIGRAQLRALVVDRAGWINDRSMRKAIETLRTRHPQGSMICSTCGAMDEEGRPIAAGKDQNSGGYFLAADLDELDRYLRQDESRIYKMLARLSRQRRRAGLKLNPMVHELTGARS